VEDSESVPVGAPAGQNQPPVLIGSRTFHILDHDKIRNLSEPIEKFIDWERFQSLASELISPRVEINLGVEADNAARDFTASISSS
jgi:hypothetical protein